MDGWMEKCSYRWVGECLDKRVETFAVEACRKAGLSWLSPLLGFPLGSRSPRPTFPALLLVTPVEAVRLPVTHSGQGDACAVFLALECGSADCMGTHRGGR